MRYCILNVFDQPALEKELLYYIGEDASNTYGYDDVMVLGPSVDYPAMRALQASCRNRKIPAFV